ncbi:MAG: molecular chaperone TorD family protein [Coriobacteriales bacterium]|nr:molecular chaperone TorD family protein [Coriobacteriales bacterium]
MTEGLKTVGVDVLINVLESRREFYLALAGFYFKPLTQEKIDVMAQTDYLPFGVGEPLLEEGFNDITRFLRKRNTGTRQTLATEFTASFGAAATYKGKTAIPYASVHLSEAGLLSQQPRAEVFRAFTRNLLRVTDPNTPDDHLSFMLEFLAIMSNRAADALREGRTEDALSYIVESKDFINEQILTWFDIFAQVADRLLQERFYRGVLKVTKGYLLMDLQTIDDLVAEMIQR